MNEKISKILKEYKAKDIDDNENLIFFHIKNFKLGVQYEDDENLQFWIEEIQGVDLPEDYFENIIEAGDLNEFEEFIMAVADGEFNYIKKIYSTLKKLEEQYDDDFSMMIKYFNVFQ